MSSYDEALRLFEELDGLDDAFIEEGMLPDEAVKPARRRLTGHRGGNFFAWLASSGWGVAILCAVVSLSVLTAIVRWGTANSDKAMGEAAPNSPNYNAPAEDKEDCMPPETEETVTLPDESARVPAGKVSTDQHGLRYQSYGNGTCILTGCLGNEPLTALHIPDYSPDGDVVAYIDGYTFRGQLSLREVTLPAGLREFDHKTFPMDAPIYRLYGNILYLGSRANLYMVAVSTADNRPGATSLHPLTRIVACHALTYDTGSYFATAWSDTVESYTHDETFTIPSGVTHIGAYALLDVGRDMTYRGYLVGWDTLTAGENSGVVRTTEGEPVTVHCMDGTAETARETRFVRVDGTAYLQDGVFYGSYFSDVRVVNEDYYAWLKAPETFGTAPDQFTVSGPYGTESRVLTPKELAAVRFTSAGVTDTALSVYLDAYNHSPEGLFAGKTVVMLYLKENALYDHEITDVIVTDGHIRVTVTRGEGDAADALGDRFILIPLDDPDGTLAGATVSYELRDPT